LRFDKISKCVDDEILMLIRSIYHHLQDGIISWNWKHKCKRWTCLHWLASIWIFWNFTSYRIFPWSFEVESNRLILHQWCFTLNAKLLINQLRWRRTRTYIGNFFRRFIMLHRCITHDPIEPPIFLG